MSKAEDLAQKAYPEGDTYIFGDASIACQVAYVKGYHQAEKDLELCWEDIEIIINAFLDLCIENKEQGKTESHTDKEWCQEVLKRFKSYGKKEI